MILDKREARYAELMSRFARGEYMVLHPSRLNLDRDIRVGNEALIPLREILRFYRAVNGTVQVLVQGILSNGNLVVTHVQTIICREGE